MQKELYLYFPQSGKNLVVDQDVIIAGRLGEYCDLKLAHYFDKGNLRTISNVHFRIDKRSEGFFMTHLGSNATELNGRALKKNQSVHLKDSDTIRLAGNDNFVIEVIGTGETAVPEGDKGVYFDDFRFQFMVDGKPIPDGWLTPLEKDLLRELYENAGQVCTYDNLAFNVWKSSEIGNAAITTTIRRLRKKLDDRSRGANDYIEAIYGRGYRLQKAQKRVKLHRDSV